MENIYVSQQLDFDGGLDGIDNLNEDTFGAGAVEEDWELDHNVLVGTEFNKLQLNRNEADFDVVSTPDFTFQNGGDHGRLFNRLSRTNETNHKMAEKVEDEVVDPAIVSLQKQTTPMYINAAEKLPSNFETSFPAMFPQTNEQNHPPTFIDSTNIRHIWEESVFDQKGGFQQMIRRMTSPPPGFAGIEPPLQDDSIVSALKCEDHSMLPPGGKIVMKAEDLEREMQASTSRGPSPTYGISIPKSGRNDSNDPHDRSLPPRSVSPVFGSPSPSNMPIGTPPKHVIMDMMHQLEQQQMSQQPGPPQLPGNSGLLPHPINLPPGLPPPRLPFLIRGSFPPGVRPSIWTHGPPMPMNPRMAQDFFNQLRMKSPMIRPMIPPNQRRGPIQQRGIARPNIRPEMNNRNYNRGRGNFQSVSGIPHARVGPGHLHPEHSKFVRMQQQLYNNNRRNYTREKITSTRDGWVGNILDPYANIMNQKEKDWVVKIQMMALQSNRPEIDDYYYQNYIERKLREGKLNTSESDKAKRLLTPTKPNSDNKKYIPVQFQNSLGKLTASSVYNPRQIIDIVHSTNQDEEPVAATSDNQQTLSKRLVVYKKIEKAFELIVVIEEISEKSEDEGFGQREVILADLKDKLAELSVVLGLDNLEKEFQFFDENIFQILKIRKGKKLLARVMLFLTQAQCEIVVRSIFAHISILIKRDARDGVLHELYGPMSQTILNCDSESILHLVSLLTTFSITSSMKDQVGVSIMSKLMYCGNLLFHQVQAKDPRWTKFIGNLVDVIIAVANPKEGSRHARPSTPLMLLEDLPFDVFSILNENLKEGLNPDVVENSFRKLVAF